MSALAEKTAAIKAVLLADKKKSIVMGVLLVVLIAVCVRQFGSSSTPNDAAASPVATPAVAPMVVAQVPAPVVTPPVSEAPKAATPVPSPISMPVEKVTITHMPRDLSRNLFTTSEWRKFRPALAIVQGPVRSTKRGSKSSMWSTAFSAIVESQREQRKELVETEKVLTAMQLQSTMTGSLPMAYISGRLVREGEVIDGFSVVQIADRRVVVRKGMHLHELVMP